MSTSSLSNTPDFKDIHEIHSKSELNNLSFVSPKNVQSRSIDQEDKPEDEYSNIVMKSINPKPQYVPPLNFSLVEDSIYRSGFPMPINYPFLKQLGLKTIIYLGDLGHENKKNKEKKDKSKDKASDKSKEKSKEKEKKKDKYGSAEIMESYKKWISTTDIKFHHLLMESSQEPFNSAIQHEQAQDSLTTALQLMLNKQNFPMLIHSNKGKHRIGLLVGLMRKLLQGWCMSGIFEEYEKFAMGKSEFDLEFIELWQPELWVDEEWKPDFVRV